MALAAWWLGDSLAKLASLNGFSVEQQGEDERMAAINNLPLDEVRSRRQKGHRPYLALMNGSPAAYGWVATQTASIGELGLNFTLPPRQRYLWDFSTLPEWQGLGMYPHLLQAIIEHERKTADRIWIIYAPENLPSGVGIEKAGFTPAGELSFQLDGSVALSPVDPADRAVAGAAVLGVSVIDGILSPCWCCGGRTVIAANEGDTCWPPALPNVTACTCAIQIKPREELHRIQGRKATDNSKAREPLNNQ